MFLLVFGTLVQAQLSFNTQKIDLGQHDTFDGIAANFLIKNSSEKTIYVLNAKIDRYTSVSFSSKMIQPDQTVTMSVKHSPRREGVFQIEVPVFFSHKRSPVPFAVEGIAGVGAVGNDLPCPDLNNPEKQSTIFGFQLTVLDSATKQPIKNAAVHLFVGPQNVGKDKSDVLGISTFEIKPNQYYFAINADGYKDKSFIAYINKNKRQIRAHLVPIPKPKKPLQQPKVYVNFKEELKTLKDISSDNFSERYFAKNNLVFLIDVSFSMKFEDKLDILKKAMNELVDMLRPVDKMALIAYSSSVEVLLPSSNIEHKDSVMQVINTLKAGGRTKGGQGIEMAYTIAKKNFIDQGNNRIIIVTDGAFNSGDTKYLKIIKKQVKNGIYISVVGIKNKKYDLADMKRIAEIGYGRYIPLNDQKMDQEKLRNEIRQGSFKGQ